MARVIIVAWIGLLTALTQSAYGQAGIRFKAGEASLWNGEFSVCLVRFISAKPVESDGGPHDMTFEPLFCVAGLFNIAEHPNVTARFWPDGGKIDALKPNALVLVFLADLSKSVMPRPTFALLDGEFMPMQRSYTILTGLDDPRISEVREKIRAARPAPSTQPTR